MGGEGGGRTLNPEPFSSQTPCTQAKIALAKLYSKFRFELEPGMAPLKVATGLTMAPEHGLWIKVSRRS
jgi:hypothetical protein